MRFEEGLNTKAKLDINFINGFGESVEFKKYLHGVYI